MTLDAALQRSPSEWAMLVAGVVLAAISMYVLRAKRFRQSPSDDSARLRARLPLLGSVTEPTRLLVATAGLFLGYHLVIWAFPATLNPVQAPREYWWVVVLLMIALVGASVTFDRAEGHRRPD